MNGTLKRTLLIHLTAVALVVLIGTGLSRAQVQLNIQPGVQLSWTAPNTNNTYHLQWSSVSSGTWTDLVAAITGDGTTHTNFDPVQSGARQYQDLEIVPGTPPSSASPTNGGFEYGSGATATGWTVDTAAGGPVYGVRTNDSPNSGSFDFQVHLASTGAGPVVQFNQAGVPVTGGTSYPFSFYSKALTGSQGYNAQWRILWNAGGDTGYQGFTSGNGSYSQFSTSVLAPASATSATIFFHIAGAAVTNWFANIDIDDVVFGSAAWFADLCCPPQFSGAIAARPSWRDTWPGARLCCRHTIREACHPPRLTPLCFCSTDMPLKFFSAGRFIKS